jgi:hypothetical protein
MMHDYSTMILISLLSGALSAMYIWADKVSDVRFSLNDAYMVSLMTSFMIFFMAFLDRHFLWLSLSFLGIVASLWLIRTQHYVSKKHYFRGMIPHHSMAVLMSKRLLVNDPTLTPKEKEFVEQIITTQNQEIIWMKERVPS